MRNLFRGENTTMDKREKFLKGTEATLENYKRKIAKIDALLTNYKSSEKAHLVAESKKVKKSIEKAEDAFQALKASSQDKFEEIKASFVEIYDTLSDAFDEFSSHFTLDQFHHYKDEITNYGNDKIVEAQECIKKNPLACAAIALGVGYILGKLLNRSK